MNKRYLGDGVYVEIESDNVILTTENGLDATNTIILDPMVLIAFGTFLSENSIPSQMLGEQSLQYIRDHYKVPARIGKHIEYKGKRGVVTGGVNAHVLLRLEEETQDRPYHPKDDDLDWS